MKKFLKHILIVGIIMYAMLYVVEYAYDYKLRNSTDNEHILWNQVAEGQVNADILFIGSSRALVHYDPKIFEKELGYSSFVLGLNSGGYDIQKVLRDLYLDNNTPPKILVQNVDVTSFNKTAKYYKPPYLPYFSYSNINTMRIVNDHAILDWALPMYKYRFYFYNYQQLIKNSSTLKDRGYEEKDITWEEFLASANKIPERPSIDFGSFDYDAGFERLEKLAKQTKELGTQFYLVWAPEYKDRLAWEEPYVTNLAKRFEEMERKHDNVQFLNFTKDSLIYDKTYFYNSFHLNKKGVQIYNSKVVDSIRKIEQSK